MQRNVKKKKRPVTKLWPYVRHSVKDPIPVINISLNEVSDLISQVRWLRVKEIQWLTLNVTADGFDLWIVCDFWLESMTAASKAYTLCSSSQIFRKYKFPHWAGTRGLTQCPDLQDVLAARTKLESFRNSEVKVFLMNIKGQPGLLAVSFGENLGFRRLIRHTYSQRWWIGNSEK